MSGNPDLCHLCGKDSQDCKCDNFEKEKNRTETALECLDAVLSAIVVAKKWASTKYPNPYISRVEEQSFKELFIHMDKAEVILRNYIGVIAVYKLKSEETAGANKLNK